LNRLRLRIVASFVVAVLVIITGWVGAGAISAGLLARQRALEAAEYATRAQEFYMAEERRDLRAARVVVLGGSLLTLALAMLVNLSLINAVREHERSRATVEKQSAQLRSFNQSLVAHEQHLATQLQKQKQLSEALRRSNEELDRFAYATSHDLRAPLRGITNLAAWIEEDVGPAIPEQVKQHLELLRNRARRLEALIEGILVYSRAGRVQEKRELVDTRELVAELVELIAPPANVKIEIAGAMPCFETERVPLNQVLMNLIQNAIKHGCPNGGSIRVSSLAEDAESWRFAVQDFGPGIARKFQSRVFGLFQTLAPRDRVEGSGIGLAMVRKLLESRGGTVTLESQEGAGAVFTVRWPKESHVPIGWMGHKT
jgi:signal transduction histidine kinase